MKIGGIQKTSLLDYPNKISTIVWTTGCNFRCPFCYNKNLVFETAHTIPEKDIFSFLKKRKSLVEGVVVSGGEPLLQKDIVKFITKVKDLGYDCKLDTNGSFPKKLEELLDKKLVDYVSMDVKAPKKKYKTLAGVSAPLPKIEQSIDLIKKRAPSYEFKTTVVPDLLKKEDILKIAQWIQGAETYYLQQFKINTPLVSSKLETSTPYSKADLEEILEKVRSFIPNCHLRGV
jgi:pyruvate formate lyase activating enzyme